MKDNKSNRNKWLHIRLTAAEYDRIHRAFSGSVHQRISDYARAMLLRKPIIGVYQNPALKDIIGELSALKKDIHGIANNFNQTVRKLNALGPTEAKKLVPGLESEQKKVLEFLTVLEHYLHQTAEKWLRS
ncbi:hypothetical protein SAMN00777080_3485 [Aquiflexum balticum DSM 16537]|uniref:Mobilisation protein (MobC) n=1 Tax=Aquiflexum balticum DSM 16537 TaxID=758820 RepID=A0A1W2H7K9_9BACT|nr:hypothetical protein [Aquiflexum balticum]SMD44849.1 hypothetical protein SAMN00777080_3485 [Aquiflexum balticum DSM 16537]